MKNNVGKIIIQRYQLEDMVNMLLENNYYLEIQKYNNDDKVQICIYENNQESEENK